jgi:hypothetical protein
VFMTDAQTELLLVFTLHCLPGGQRFIPLSRIIGVCPSEPPAQKDLANLNELATEILTANQGTKC